MLKHTVTPRDPHPFTAMKNLSVLFLAIVTWNMSQLSAQVILGPTINAPGLPSADELICDIPLELEVEIEDGPLEGDLVNDFTLYDTEGNQAVLSEVLALGKPVLLISASYSCMVFRGKVALINNIKTERSDELTVLVVYTVEAHPYGDISPYYGFENTGEQNFEDGVLEPQAVTYGQRVEQAAVMKDALGLQTRVLIDGPCNEWWTANGQAPNNAYLIDTNGIVYDAQAWLDRYPEDIKSSISGLVGEDITGAPVPTGIVGLDSYDEDCVEGEPGSTIIAHVNLSNEDTSASFLDIIRLSEDIPGTWTTSICTDVCYPPETENVDMFVEEGTAASLSFYFYTTLTGAEGQANLLIKNIYIPSNSFEVLLKACTELGAPAEVEIVKHEMYLYPNPVAEQLQVFIPGWSGQDIQIRILDLYGRTVHIVPCTLDTIDPVCSVSLQDFPTGSYLIQVMNTHTQESFTETILKH